MHLLKAPGWAVYLGALGAINVILILVFWVGAAWTYLKYVELSSIEAAADKERKRAQVYKWRCMLANVTSAAKYSDKCVREILPTYEDYLSLQPHLSAATLAYLAGDHEPEAAASMIEPVAVEVSMLAKGWGVE
jgi:hypothetical protein